MAIELFTRVSGHVMSYRLHADADGILRAMKTDLYVGKSYYKPELAALTAWRCVLDGLDAQLALVAAGQACIEQLPLGYAVTNTGETLYDRLMSVPSDRLLLPGNNCPPQANPVTQRRR